MVFSITWLMCFATSKDVFMIFRWKDQLSAAFPSATEPPGRDMAIRDCQQPALRAGSRPGGHWCAAAHLDFRWWTVSRPLSRSRPQGQSVALRGMKPLSSSTCGRKNETVDQHLCDFCDVIFRIQRHILELFGCLQLVGQRISQRITTIFRSL